MHILMTGAAGMIGRKLTARLIKDGKLNGKPIDQLTLTDVVPPDLARALKGRAAAAWERLRPSLKREHVKSLLSAKKADTRARRLDKILASLAERRGGMKAGS